MRWLLILSTAIAVHSTRDPQKEAIRFCEAFVQCSSVAVLEERLCLGNTLKRPYWLPDSRDKHGCHQKLRNDYILLEKMEEKLDSLMTACLVQNTIPFTAEQLLQCNARVLKETAKFSFGHSIYYVPNHCFTGVESRRERQCGAAKACCPALSRCPTVPGQLELVKSIEETKINMRKRAKDCENGTEIEKLVLPLEYTDNQQQDSSGPQILKVNISQATGAEQEPKPDQGTNTTVGSSDGSASGYEISPSGYEADYPAPAKSPAPSDKEAPQATSTQAAGSAGSYDGSESAGQVSSPVGDGKSKKVNFPRISDHGSRKSELKEEDGSLTISSKPKLSFPYDRMAVATSQGVIIVNFHDKDSLPAISKFPTFHRSNKSYDELFEHAMKNTNDYKAKIEQLNRGEDARQGLDSLLKAGQVFGRAPTHGVGAPGSIEAKPAEVSGSVRQVEMTDGEDDDSRNGEFVTSAPVIFLGKNETRKTQNRGSKCTMGELRAQTKKLQVILALLGEKEDSDDMKEIKELTKKWQENFKHGIVSLKDKTTKKEIKEALEDLISKFDRVNLKLVRNSVLNETDAVDSDMASDCDPTTMDEVTEALGSEQIISSHSKGGKDAQHKFDRARKRIDDLREHVIVEDGVEKLILSGTDDDVTADMSMDSADASIQVDDKPSQKSSDSEEIHDWSNEEYKRELEKYKKEHHLNVTASTRNETSCDLYMRCRNQMHLAVDSCAWRFASSKILPTLAESAESLLYKGDDLCDPAEQPLYEELYELVIKRNTQLRLCLDRKNAAFFATSVCLPYSSSEHIRFNSALLRLLTEDYKHSSQCFRDANLIQEKCTKLRECCPNFDSCRQETMDITMEQAIISKTAQLNENKQNCLKEKAREAFKTTLRGLLGKSGRETLTKLKQGKLSSDIARGAQALARLR